MKSLVVFVCLVSSSYCTIFHLTNVTEDPFKIRAERNQATVDAGCSVGGRLLKIGDRWTQAGICGIFTCQENHYRTIDTPCPHLRFQEGSGCVISEEDPTKDYPACCPKMICPNQKLEQKTQDKRGSFLSGFTL